MSHHLPALVEESLEYLMTDPSGIYFDATIGFGGHSSEFLKSLDSKAILIAADKDLIAFNFCKERFKDETRIKLYRSDFSNIDVISKIEDISSYNGIFADLGVSSYQFDDAEAGFTYRIETELDLRMDKSEGFPAYRVINEKSADELRDIFQKYGEEKRSGTIARRIEALRKTRPIKTTKELRDIIESVTPYKKRMSTLSRIFQALRIYVNNELDQLDKFIDRAVPLLKSGGRIGIISYHSLEDRIVKNKFRYESLDCVCPPEVPVCKCGKEKRLAILTKKPIVPGAEETNQNIRARSAKLRVAEKI